MDKKDVQLRQVIVAPAEDDPIVAIQHGIADTLLVLRLVLPDLSPADLAALRLVSRQLGEAASQLITSLRCTPATPLQLARNAGHVFPAAEALVLDLSTHDMSRIAVLEGYPRWGAVWKRLVWFKNFAKLQILTLSGRTVRAQPGQSDAPAVFLIYLTCGLIVPVVYLILIAYAYVLSALKGIVKLCLACYLVCWNAQRGVCSYTDCCAIFADMFRNGVLEKAYSRHVDDARLRLWQHWKLVPSLAPVLLQVKHLSVVCKAESASAVSPALLQKLLTRCSSLETFTYHCKDSTRLTFQGQGTTAAERRASLLPQLAAMQCFRPLLHPASWAAHRCLTSAYFRYPSPSQQGFESLSASLANSSLRSLRIHLLPGHLWSDAEFTCHLAALPPGVTSLTLECTIISSQGAVHPQAPLPSLSSLQQLELHLSVASGVENAVLVVQLASAWAHLTQLTHLSITGLPWGPFSSLPNIRHLEVFRCYLPGQDTPASSLLHLASRLEHLALHDGWAVEAETLQRLTALTHLELKNVLELTPDHCRAITHLPRLAALHLDPTSCSQAPPDPRPSHDRPLLPATLSTLQLTLSASPQDELLTAVLNTFAVSTRLPVGAALCISVISTHPPTCAQTSGYSLGKLGPLDQWSPCWRSSVLPSDWLATHPPPGLCSSGAAACQEIPSTSALASTSWAWFSTCDPEGGVHLLYLRCRIPPRNRPTSKNPTTRLCLDVTSTCIAPTPDSFQRALLLTADGGQQAKLQIDRVQEDAAGAPTSSSNLLLQHSVSGGTWHVSPFSTAADHPLLLHPAHLLGLPPGGLAGLVSVTIHDCSLLVPTKSGDGTEPLRALVAAAPNLRSVDLRRLACDAGTSLCMVTRRCRQLQEINVEPVSGGLPCSLQATKPGTWQLQSWNAAVGAVALAVCLRQLEATSLTLQAAPTADICWALADVPNLDTLIIDTGPGPNACAPHGRLLPAQPRAPFPPSISTLLLTPRGLASGYAAHCLNALALWTHLPTGSLIEVALTDCGLVFDGLDSPALHDLGALEQWCPGWRALLLPALWSTPYNLERSSAAPVHGGRSDSSNYFADQCTRFCSGTSTMSHWAASKLVGGSETCFEGLFVDCQLFDGKHQGGDGLRRCQPFELITRVSAHSTPAPHTIQEALLVAAGLPNQEATLTNLGLTYRSRYLEQAYQLALPGSLSVQTSLQAMSGHSHSLFGYQCAFEARGSKSLVLSPAQLLWLRCSSLPGLVTVQLRYCAALTARSNGAAPLRALVAAAPNLRHVDLRRLACDSDAVLQALTHHCQALEQVSIGLVAGGLPCTSQSVRQAMKVMRLPGGQARGRPRSRKLWVPLGADVDCGTRDAWVQRMGGGWQCEEVAPASGGLAVHHPGMSKYHFVIKA